MALTIIKATGVDVAGLSAVIGGGGPKITSIGYLGNDTATDPAGGQTITLNGSGFVSGFKILLNGSQVSVVSFVSSTQVTFISPVKTVGTYILYLINPDGGTAISVPGVEYSGVPSWSTATGSLASTTQSTSISVTVAATSDSAVSYSLFSGTLPAGVTLNSSTGVISGTTPAVASNTTYSFVIRATDAQNQDTDRSFSITVNAANATPTIEYLVVAGGGSAGSASPSRGPSAGGGAGGFLDGTMSVGSSLTISVGAGGATTTWLASTPYEYSGNNGANSSIVGSNSITATGGGGGAGSNAAKPGLNGGSGGGGNWAGQQTVAATGISGQGFAGAITTGTQYACGGGGGAGGVGGAAGGFGIANGGAGKSSSISGTSTTYAGGGGGGGTGTVMGAGNWIGGTATDGGAAGLVTGNGTAAANNLGGGGGGTGGGFGGTNAGGNGGAGGSGIVIIRYASTYDAAAATTGSPTITVAGGYRVYKFTASGSITF